MRKKKDIVSMTLTDEDLAPVRRNADAHARAASKMQADAIRSEVELQRRGEVSELTVPQVVAFDLSGGFKAAALQKARAKGYNSMQNLRKTPDGWMFEAFNAPADQL